jgi:membrane fusion protein, multidrug efflux system
MPDSGDSSSTRGQKVAPGATDGNDAPTIPPVRKRRRGLWFLALALLIGAGFGAWEISQRLAFVFEEDARIETDLINVGSQVAGSVTNIAVSEGDSIVKDQVLFTVDDRQSQLSLEALNAQLGGVEAERQRLEAERSLVEAQTDSRLASVKAELAAAQVAVSSLKPQLELAKRELERTRQLFEQKVSSRRQLDQAEQQHQQIDREYRIAVAELRSAEAKIAEAEAERRRLAVLDGELAMLERKAEEYRARIGQQRIDLTDRTIRSPIDGVVDQTFVEPGEYVEPGQRLALVHDPSKVWVKAHIKETVVRRLALGQSVELFVDAYPDKTFTGEIVAIGNTTTSEFALLPTPNPSGNFTKVTQRLPVKIAVPQSEGMLKPGMMVEVKIAASR